MGKDKTSLILFLVLISAILWVIILPGPRVANDFPYVSQDSLKEGFNLPQTWSLRGNGIGQYVVSTLWAWPTDFIYGIGAKLGINFSILERILGVFPILILGAWSILKLLKYHKIGNWGQLIGTLFYLFNTYILLVIDGGQFSIGLAYAFMPFVFLTIIKSIDSSFRQSLLAGICVFLLGTFDIRLVYVIVILLLVYFFYSLIFYSREKLFGLTLGWLKVALVVAVIYLTLSSYWILPLLLARVPTLPATYTRESQTSFLNFTQLKHSISLLQPHWYENVFGKIPPFRKEFLLIPILAFLAPVLKRRDKQVWFWAIVALVAVFLTKGANPPFPNIYPWLFSHIPGFSLFRDSTKFFFLVALSYSVLIAFTVDEIMKRFPKFKFIFTLFLLSYFVYLTSPIWLGKMTGIFSQSRYQEEYFALADKFEKDGDFGRVFWIPSKAPLGFSSPTHPSVEASRLESLRPFAIGTVGTFETQNFIREANYMGELFGIAGIKYLAYPYFDPKRDDMSKEEVDYYNTFLSQIENLPWISEKISDVPIPVFKTKENKDKFFLAENTYFVVGADSIYQDIVKIGAKFSDNALIFVEENPGLINQIEKAGKAKIVLYDKNLTDLLLSFVDKDKFISLGINLDFSPNQTGWWKRETSDLVWWRNFLQQKYGLDNSDFDYGGGWAVAEGQKQLTISNKQLTKGNILFARVMKSNRGGKIGFYQGDTLIGKIDTKIEKPEKVKIKLSGYKEIPDKFFEYDKADFQWFEVGRLAIDQNNPLRGQPLTIRTEGDINVVNTLVSISEDEFKAYQNRINQLIHQGRIVYWDKLSKFEKQNLFSQKTSDIKVSYERKAPTLYKVKVEGLKLPATLVFSETYDALWEIRGGSGSYPLYSLINGFKIEKDGTYEIYFIPQKYVIPGLIISGATLFCLIILLKWIKT